MGWALIGLMIVATLVSRLLTVKVHPDLLDERSGSMRAENTKSWDKWLSPLMALTPLLVLMVANRFFSAVVRIQTERGHDAVDKGSYAVVRHPGYTELTKRTRFRLLPGVW